MDRHRREFPGIVVDDPPDDGVVRAAVLVPLFDDAEGRTRLVLTKRPMHMPTHAGDLAFPGGKPHPEDRGPVDTALREAWEEVGIDPQSVQVLGYLPAIHTVEYSRMVVPVVGWLADPPALRPDPNEVELVLEPEVAAFAVETAWRYEMWRGRRVWFFELGEEVLWGATARMVRQLVGLHD